MHDTHAARSVPSRFVTRSPRTVWTLVLALLLGLSAVLAPAAAADGPTETTVTLVSDPDSEVGHGTAQLWRAGPDRVDVRPFNTGVTVEARAGQTGYPWVGGLSFAPPKGQPLIIGKTYSAQDVVAPAEDQSVMRVNYQGSCGTTGSGTFTVHDAAADLSRLWLTYTYTCGGSSASFGDVRHNEPADADVAMAPHRAAWPTQYVGGSGRPIPVTLLNTGTAPLQVSGVALTGPAAGDYTAAVGSCATIEPGASCAFDVGFTPTRQGTRPATLTITDSSAAGSRTVSLDATVGRPSTLTLVDGAAAAGDTSWRSGPDRLDVSVSANSATVHAVRAGGDADTNLSASFAPPPGQELAVGTYANTVKVAGSDDPRPRMWIGDCYSQVGRFTVVDLPADRSRLWITFEFSCNNAKGLTFGEIRWNQPGDPDLLVYPGRIAWPDQPQAAVGRRVPVHVVNTGTDAVSVSSVASSTADFAPGDAAPCASVAPRAECSLDIAFTPADFGRRDATLTIADSTLLGSHTVGLGGLALYPDSAWIVASSAGGSGAHGETDEWHSGADPIEIVASAGRITATVSHPGSTDSTEFSFGPGAGKTFAEGTYAGAGSGNTSANGPGPTAPRMAFTRNHQVCSLQTGSFKIRDMAPDLSSFALSFDSYCLGDHAFGEIRRNMPANRDVLLTPAAVSWPVGYVGGDTQQVPITVANTGDGPLDVDRAAVIGPSADAFYAGLGDCRTVAPGASCTMSVSFRPVRTGTQERATLELATSAGRQTVPLDGFVGRPSTVTMAGVADQLTQGHPLLWRSGVDKIEVTGGAEGVNVAAARTTAPEARFTFSFFAPAGQAMTTGRYEKGSRIKIGGTGENCDPASGWFEVYDFAPDLSHFWIVYQTTCSGTQ